MALADAPVLDYLDLHFLFIMDMDASNKGLGAVLSQVDPEVVCILVYFSRMLIKLDRNFCVTQWELLAEVQAYENFLPYCTSLVSGSCGRQTIHHLRCY